MNMRVTALVCSLGLSAFASACSEAPAPNEQLAFALTLSAVAPSLVSPQGLLLLELAHAGLSRTHYALRVTWKSQTLWLDAESLSATRLMVSDLRELEALLGQGEQQVLIELFGTRDSLSALTQPFPLTLQVVQSLEPRLELVQTESQQLIAQTTLTLRGQNFPLHREGELVVRLEGQFQGSNGRLHMLPPTYLPVELGTLSQLSTFVLSDLRQQRSLLLSPDLFPLFEGHFTGSLSLYLNQEALGDPHALSLPVALPYLTGYQQVSGARGTFIDIAGPGFNRPEDAPLALELQGTFRHHDSSTPEESLTHVSFHEGSFEQAFRFALSPDIRDGQLTGLGSTRGEFTGQATPLLFSANSVHRGPSTPITLKVGPNEQHVALRWDAAGLEAIHRFGLLAGLSQLESAILSVLSELFAGLRLYPTFEALPSHVAQAVHIQLRGPDLNGAGLLGLDTSLGLDRGNLILNEYLGGFVGASELFPQGAFGGIFLDELWQFSASHGSSSLADVSFDAIFSATAPELGGSPLSANPQHWSPAQADALQTLAELIAHTLAHELGHVLGLPAEGEHAHPLIDQPGNLMDAGEDRPFTERANLPPSKRATFSEVDQAYLEQILGED